MPGVDDGCGLRDLIHAGELTGHEAAATAEVD
jgi:hypothetical protein